MFDILWQVVYKCLDVVSIADDVSLCIHWNKMSEVDNFFKFYSSRERRENLQATISKGYE